MKSLALIFLLALVVAAPSLTEAQNPIPNPGFETWVGGYPSGWTTNNLPTIAITVTQTATSHSGSSALNGTVVSAYGISSYPPYISSQFSVAQRYATFSGWYSFSAVAGDSLYGWLVMYMSNSPIGYAFFNNKTTRSAYTQFNVNIQYIASGVPDNCDMFFGIIGATNASDSPHVGSTFNLDDLSLSGTATGIEVQPSEPATFSLSQNFPNPFNPSTMITYQTAKTGQVRLSVYDILGREVATLVNTVQPQGSHEVRFDAGELSSGVYIYRLQTPGFVQQRKMIFQK
jgi:hypothetical protein